MQRTGLLALVAVISCACVVGSGNGPVSDQGLRAVWSPGATPGWVATGGATPRSKVDVVAGTAGPIWTHA